MAAAVDAAGRVHVAYGGRQLYHAWQAGNDPWQVEVVDEELNAGRGATLALDSAGQPRIFYWDENSQSLRYAWYDGATWQRAWVAFDLPLAEAPEAQMAVDGAG